ncbi:MAG: peptidylprolyl isomerase [Bacteroidetes bacterium]|nr:peptidylprolyl isomerase [Bacteroidota bacterium]
MKTNILLLSFLSMILFSGCSSTKTGNTSVKKGKEQLVLISTNYGDMKVKLYNETPIHRDNFIRLVVQEFYDSLTFHRVINQFMIQGGNPETKLSAGEKSEEGETLPAEFRPNLFHKKGALAAARMGDNVNPEKKSSYSQFYIVQGKVFNDASLAAAEARSGHTIPEDQRAVYKTIGGTPHLDQNYTVFGEVVEGLWVIDKIAEVKTGPGDVPVENVIMTMKLVKK